MFYNSKFFKYCLYVILVLLIIVLIGKTGFIIKFIKQMFSLIFIPIIIGLLFYYILRPIVKFLTKKNVNKGISSLIVTLLFIFIIALIIIYGSSNIKHAFDKSLMDVIQEIQDSIEIINNKIYDISGGQLTNKLNSYLNELPSMIGSNISNIFSEIANVGSQIIIIPFVIFYFLKDDSNYVKSFISIIPQSYKEQVKGLLKDIDNILSTYITGQLIVAIIVGVLMYLGFSIIRLPNALLLSIFAVITNIIPFIGAFLAVIPALAIAMTIDGWMIVKVIIISIIAQQIEGNIITPNILGNKLDINPLLVLFIILIFISLFGFIGAFIAVPVYSIIKVTVVDIHRMRTSKTLDTR